MSKDNKIKYGLFLLKKDGDHLTILETEKFDEAYSIWKETKEQWAACIKDQKPFELTKPIVTAFDPGLIYEVTVRPVPEISSNTNNPYTNKMQREGFSSTFGSRSDMLDNGFKL